MDENTTILYREFISEKVLGGGMIDPVQVIIDFSSKSNAQQMAEFNTWLAEKQAKYEQNKLDIAASNLTEIKKLDDKLTTIEGVLNG
jgi:hypothetical protein